jgi:hypothetical protein
MTIPDRVLNRRTLLRQSLLEGTDASLAIAIGRCLRPRRRRNRTVTHAERPSGFVVCRRHPRHDLVQARDAGWSISGPSENLTLPRDATSRSL